MDHPYDIIYLITHDIFLDETFLIDLCFVLLLGFFLIPHKKHQLAVLPSVLFRALANLVLQTLAILFLLGNLPQGANHESFHNYKASMMAI